MRRLLALMVLVTYSVHAEEPGSQFLRAVGSGNRCARYFLADTWSSSGDLGKTEYWAQKTADNGDADAYALLAQIKITNPVSLGYSQAKALVEEATQAGSKTGEITLTRILVNTQAGHTDYPKATALLQNVSEDLGNDSAVDVQMLPGPIYANGVGILINDERTTWYFKHSSAISHTGYSEYWVRTTLLNGEQGFIVKSKQKALYWLNLSYMEGFDTGCGEFDRLTSGQSSQA